ncbi:hypothetical protein SEMRO_2288_G322090.1 [Seminavis robusta]|uniref:Uncharacterized protein n=1 Tax=Seminavis robusta TaxID=568900 RepID=A0A9N8HZI3_9STRA|nr:hypothetical protein SEMRO_2288_G322090.1 [Seminavis robusta]|eukprot:Sro2288_g322090.1 n/a (248) ;mRNA; r:9383-10126
MDYRNTYAEFANSGSPRGYLSRQSASLASPILTQRTSPITSTTAAPPLSPISRSLLLSNAMGPLDRKLPPGNSAIFANESLERLRLPIRPDIFSVPRSPAPPAAFKPRRRPKLPPASSSSAVFRRKRFLVFMKVLLKCLKRDMTKNPQSARLYQHAKAIIADCTQRNRQKDPHYCPLPEAVERRLRPVVGEAQWKRAHACLDLYLEKRRQLHRLPASHHTTTTVDPLQVSFPEICRTASDPWRKEGV